MSGRQILVYVFWIGPAILQILLLAHMVRTKLHCQLRVFFAYIAFSVLRAGLLFWTYHSIGGNSKAYFVAYWSTALTDTVLVLAVIREVYAQVLHQYEGLKALSDVLFRWAFLVLIMVAAIIAMYGPARDSDRIIAGILVLDRCAVFVQLGLLLLLLGFSSLLALRWRHYVFGVAVGLCLFTTVELVALTMRTRFGLIGAGTYSLVKSAAYTCAVLVWIAYLLGRDRIATRPRALPNFPLEQFNTAILELMNR